MSTVLIHESRRLVFPLDTVVDAVIELEREHQRWPARAKLTQVKLSRSSGLSLSLSTSEKAPVEERHYNLATIAAAVIHYCVRMRVPMPRNASKSVKIIAEGFELALETKLFLQRQHAEPPPDASINTVTVERLPEEAAAAAVPAEAESAAAPSADAPSVSEGGTTGAQAEMPAETATGGEQAA